MPARKKQKAAVYARVSSTSQKDGSGIQRQKSKCKARAKDLGDTIAVEVSEVISGSLPLAERTEFKPPDGEMQARGHQQNLRGRNESVL